MEAIEIMDLNFIVSSFVAMFIIVDAIANVPLYVALLTHFKPEDRRGMITRAVVIAFLVLVIFTLLGAYILSTLNVEIYSFRIAGGIILFLISMEMLFGRRTATESSAEEEDEAKRRDDIVATPMAVPLLTGPGAITTGIVLFNSAPGIAEQAFLIIDIALVFIVSYVILLRSEQLNNALGAIGTKVITRIMGLLLSAMAVQFVVNGIRESVTII